MKNITIKSLREKQKEKFHTAEDFFKKPKNEINELTEKPYKPRNIKIVFKSIFFIIFVLIVGGIGGILMDRFIIPSLVINYPKLNQYEFFRRVNEGTTIVEVVKEVNISQNMAMVQAIEKVSPSVVQVLEFINDNKDPVYRGAGTILTSDGLVIVSIESITHDKNNSEEDVSKIKIRTKDEKIYDTKLITVDPFMGLAIIKIDKNNLPVVALSNSENIKLGEKIVIIDNSVVEDIVSKFIDDYISTEKESSSKEQKRIKIVNSLKDSFYGAPVVNLKGEIIGISQGGNLFIPTNELSSFIQSSMDKV